LEELISSLGHENVNVLVMETCQGHVASFPTAIAKVQLVSSTAGCIDVHRDWGISGWRKQLSTRDGVRVRKGLIEGVGSMGGHWGVEHSSEHCICESVFVTERSSFIPSMDIIICWVPLSQVPIFTCSRSTFF
jgi:hypothetical protein